MPTPNLNFPLISESSTPNHVTSREGISRLDKASYISVKSKSISVPPTSPTVGDKYIVGPSPTGVWSGKTDFIAFYDSNGWIFFVPENGSLINDESTKLLNIYSNTAPVGWTVQQGGLGPGYGGSSVTSHTVSVGSKIFITQAGLAYGIGQRVRAGVSNSIWVEGAISSYVGTNLIIVVDTISGTGTFTSWLFSIAGTPGLGAVNSVNGQVGNVTINLNGSNGGLTPETSKFFIGNDEYEPIAVDFAGKVVIGVRVSDGKTWSINIERMESITENLAYSLPELPNQLSKIVPFVYHGGGPLIAYDVEEDIILEGVPRVKNITKELAGKSTPKISLTERLGGVGYGQSNGGGAGYTNVTTNIAFYTNVLTFLNGPKPDKTPSNFDGTSILVENSNQGDTANYFSGETIMSGFASRFMEDSISSSNFITSNMPQLFMSTAGDGGASLAVLKASSFERFKKHVDKQVERAIISNKTFSIPFLTWIQGESDADIDALTVQQRYDAELDMFNMMINYVKGATSQTFDPVILYAQVNYGSKRPNKPGAIALAQYNLHNGSSRILATPMYPFQYFDQYHPDSIGRRLIGEYMGRAAKISIIDNKIWNGLRPLSVISRGNVVYAKFDVPVSPIQLDCFTIEKVKDFGFQIRDSVETKTISEIQVVSHDQIKFVCTTNVEASGILRYALDYTTTTKMDPVYGAGGNLRDSDNTSVFIGLAGPTDVNTKRYYLRNWCYAFEKSIERLNPSVK